MTDPVVREFLLGFWKIHILHHAEEQGVYGQWMLEELQRHGYRLSPGTLYPLLARMARRGWLRATEPKRSRDARVYRITPAGAEVLKRSARVTGRTAARSRTASRTRLAPKRANVQVAQARDRAASQVRLTDGTERARRRRAEHAAGGRDLS